MREAWQGPLEKIDDYRWRIPQSYDRGMRVPGLIFASEKLLKDITKDQSLQQVANVAHLPGIVRASLAMPDIHWGYGFCIGGVAATDPEAGGVVSPGGVGFDINCLTGDAEVLHADGFTLAIQAYELRQLETPVQCLAQGSRRLEGATPIRFIVHRHRDDVRQLTTRTGKQIRATSDHPFLTPQGMRPLKTLVAGDNVAVVPFQGVAYELPQSASILTSADIRDTLRHLKGRKSIDQARMVAGQLESRGLLPLTYQHPRLPSVLRIMGMVFGDGTMNFIGARGDGILSFSGQAADLESVREDLVILGYMPGPVHWKTTELLYKGQRRYSRNAYFIVNASSLVVFLAALGVPVGRKVTQPYHVPSWLWKTAKWQQRLFLAAFFGAKLTRPRARAERRGNFCAPALSMNKANSLLKNGVEFLEEIAGLCRGFGVTTSQLIVRRQHVSRQGLRTRYLELVFEPNTQNLLALWGRIGFAYHREKAALAAVASHYLALKRQTLTARRDAVAQTRALHTRGYTHAQVHQVVGSQFVNARYVQSVAQRKRIAPARIPHCFPAYDEFAQMATIGLEGSGAVWDVVETITPVKGAHTVYDFSVGHNDHNFVANGFVVSNCGVRLMRTDLDAEEVQPKLKTLVATLFNTIPCGVGMSGDIRFSKADAPKVMTQGARWAVAQGHGHPSDLEHTESQGAIEGADPDVVSDRAVKRGHDQLGTLGSGNHFLEVQAVETVFDEAAANAFGIHVGQVTVMMHSGSRGFGYQICDDHLGIMERAMQAYGIHVPDRQLACAPVNSEEGQRYLGAIRCAANFAWANRQCLMHLARQAFERVFGKGWQALGMWLVYDVAHNIAKFERYKVNGEEKLLCVHRKGATRAFPPDHPEIPGDYRAIGQPVIIPGDMGRNSYLLVGTQAAMEESFGTVCHGAGRVMSRTQAVKEAAGRSIEHELEQQGIIVMGRGRKGVAEEQPKAYKDVNDVVHVVHHAGLARRVARMRPLGVIKG